MKRLNETRLYSILKVSLSLFNSSYFICNVIQVTLSIMCDAFETGRCPLSILVTCNSACFRQLQSYLRDQLILFDIVSLSETDKGILLFSARDREECHTFLKSMYTEAAQFGNCFHEYVLNDCFSSNRSSSNLCECDSTS